MKVKTTFLIVFFFNLTCFAQPNFNISFDESINLGRVEATTRFVIDDVGNVIGNEINSYKFKKPGIYHIRIINDHIKEKHDCGYNLLPAEITVNVSRIKMDFDTHSIILSQPILKNKDTKGIVMSVKVSIKTFDRQPVQLNKAVVQSAGLGTNITAKLRDYYDKLPDGQHVLEYELNGTINETTYLMFDFIDPNGKIHGTALQTQVE